MASLGRPALSAERFVADPFSGRWRAPVPHRRPRALERRRRAGIPRPPRPAGQAAWLPHRASRKSRHACWRSRGGPGGSGRSAKAWPAASWSATTPALSAPRRKPSRNQRLRAALQAELPGIHGSGV
ncbi:hypothetical protein ACPA9J_18955 [Pseudomonas aeruginosa]